MTPRVTFHHSRHTFHVSSLLFIITDVHPGLQHLLQRASTRRQAAYRPGTTANHDRYMQTYVAFCIQYNIDDLAPTPTHLSAYVEFLLDSNISPSTVPNFLAGVKHYLKAAGMDASALNSYTVGLTLRSLKMAYTGTPNKKAGLTLKHVQQLVAYCELKVLLGFTLRLAILLGFFRLLRISNLAPLTAQRFDPARDSTRADLQFHSPGLQYTQKWAKNRQTKLDQQDLPQVPIPHFPGDPLDPVQALIDLQNLTPSALPHDPLLLIPNADGTFCIFDQRRFRHEFRRALIACDLDPRRYTPHSLRRGGATLLHQHGAHTTDIKRQGLWRSDAVNAYIDDHVLTKSSVIHAFQHSVNQGASTSKQPPQPAPRPSTPPRSPPRTRHRPRPYSFKKGPNHKNKRSYRAPDRRKH